MNGKGNRLNMAPVLYRSDSVELKKEASFKGGLFVSFFRDPDYPRSHFPSPRRISTIFLASSFNKR